MKRVIRLTESTLRRVVLEAVEKTLGSSFFNNIDSNHSNSSYNENDSIAPNRKNSEKVYNGIISMIESDTYLKIDNEYHMRDGGSWGLYVICEKTPMEPVNGTRMMEKYPEELYLADFGKKINDIYGSKGVTTNVEKKSDWSGESKQTLVIHFNVRFRG